MDVGLAKLTLAANGGRLEGPQFPEAGDDSLPPHPPAVTTAQTGVSIVAGMVPPSPPSSMPSP